MTNFRVIAGTGAWVLSGVNTFSANLVRGLRAQGVPAEILLTGKQILPGPPDLELQRLAVSSETPLRRRWAALISYPLSPRNR